MLTQTVISRLLSHVLPAACSSPLPLQGLSHGAATEDASNPLPRVRSELTQYPATLWYGSGFAMSDRDDPVIRCGYRTTGYPPLARPPSWFSVLLHPPTSV